MGGVALFSRQILSARTFSSGFWAPPSHRVLLLIFGEFFPYGLFIGAATLIWIAWNPRPEKLLLDPMFGGERLGWCFLLIPIAGYVAAKLVTNAFYNRYFIGMLPGVALAFACALWRYFRHRPARSVGIVLLMLCIGVGHQISVTANPLAIEPLSAKWEALKLNEALAWEAVLLKDGKKTIALQADGLIGLESRYYSKHPERYALVLTPGMVGIARLQQNLAQFRPVRFWSLEDLRAAARDTALIDPSDQLLKAMSDSGFEIKQVATDPLKIVYLE